MRLVDADEVLNAIYRYAREDGYINLHIGTIDTIISNVPTVKRPRGVWKDFTDDGYVECPFCGSATNCDGNIDDLHYCFSCGADMRQKASETETWNGFHGQLEVPKGTFDKIWNDEEGEAE